MAKVTKVTKVAKKEVPAKKCGGKAKGGKKK